MHYLDNASTTKPCPEAVTAAVRAMTDDFGNPSSIHRLGTAAERLIEDARSEVAKAVRCRPEEIFFTSGGTEADNWAVFSSAYMLRHAGKHIITTAIEHEAVLNSCRRLESQGYTVTYLAPDAAGAVSAGDVERALREDTVLVSVMLVNNENGAVAPIGEISQVLKAARSRAVLHTDAVQGLMKVPVDARSLGADLISLSAHKVHGLKGCGALYIRKSLRLPPFICGGGQESGFRSGTQAVPQISAFGAACSAGMADAGAADRMAKLRDHIVGRLRAQIPDCVCLYGDAPHILTVSIPGCPSQPTLNLLSQKEIYVSAGSACSRGKRSHVLTAMGIDPKVIDCAIRVSLSRFSTLEDADALCDGLLDVRSSFVKSPGARR